MKCIIVGASALNVKNINVENDDLVIASDGGYNNLLSLNIKPNLLVGDLDSIKDIPQDIETIKFNAEKDETDTYLAICEGIKRGYKEFLLYGCLGNRLEHTLANIQNIISFKKKGINCTLLDDDTKVLPLLKDDMANINGNNIYVSVFSFTKKSNINIEDMKYNLKNKNITYKFPLGIDNETIGKSGVIKVNRGIVILIISKKKD